MKNNGGSSQKKMELGGDNAFLFCRSLPSSPLLEDLVAYLYTNRITILPLAGSDNGMDKRNRTSPCPLSTQRPDCQAQQAYLATLGNGRCSPPGLGHILFPELAESAPRLLRSQESRGLTWLSSPSRPILPLQAMAGVAHRV